jgi:DNA repair protein RadC
MLLSRQNTFKGYVMIDYIGETKINTRTSNTKISKASDVFNEIEEFKDKVQEHFIVIYLDGANKIIESRVITIGTLNQSLVHQEKFLVLLLQINQQVSS